MTTKEQAIPGNSGISATGSLPNHHGRGHPAAVRHRQAGHLDSVRPAPGILASGCGRPNRGQTIAADDVSGCNFMNSIMIGAYSAKCAQRSPVPWRSAVVLLVSYTVGWDR